MHIEIIKTTLGPLEIICASHKSEILIVELRKNNCSSFNCVQKKKNLNKNNRLQVLLKVANTKSGPILAMDVGDGKCYLITEMRDKRELTL